MIPRDTHVATIGRLLDQFPVVALLGARQDGKTTPSVRSALEHLDLERLYLVHAGEHRFPLAERVEALPLRALATLPEL
jgi:hypothetical protein